MSTKSFFLQNVVSASRTMNPRRASTIPITETVIETFGNTTSWVCPTGVTSVEYLVVAGGGSGGTAYGGGGGAGGFRTGTGLAVTAGNTYTITVGAGGAARGASPSYFIGDPGSASQFSDIVSAGGGGGGAIPSNGVGLSGGSGGGGGYYSEIGGTTAGGTGNTPATSPSQGNNGGSGANNPSLAVTSATPQLIAKDA